MTSSQAAENEHSWLLGGAQASFVARGAADDGRRSEAYSTLQAQRGDGTFDRAGDVQSSSGFSRLMGALRWRKGKKPRRESASATMEESKGHGIRASAEDVSSAKLGTFSGVFVPVFLNVISILMFLRFGFIIGQAGVLGIAAMLVVCYLINLISSLSLSAIATNGTVRGGGAYYMISRSLGPEFGGSIGIVFYLGLVTSAGMNAVGLVDCLCQTMGRIEGTWQHWIPDDYWYRYLWGTLVLVGCTLVCLGGSSAFAKCSNFLFAILLIATLSIPVSAFYVRPFVDERLHIEYTGMSLVTLLKNLPPIFTKGAAGSIIHRREDFRDLFGILFPATAGIFAGASMSGDLKKPSRAIPAGTLYGLVATFFLYVLVILALGSTIARESFYKNVNIIQDVALSGTVILCGELATSLFSTLIGVIGAAKLLQALARDDLMPGLKIFAKGTGKNDEPFEAIFFTYAIAQLTMLLNINQIASFVTMTFLITFLVINLACFLLKISSAPNFRPSFKYFNWQIALFGTLISMFTMFFADEIYACLSLGLVVALFAVIHYTATPKTWGDVSQALIYHSVRKYLLRLRQEHVKFWRPQILLFVNDPRRSYKLIQFCNSLKKSGLFILGHVIVSHDFASAVPEARKQQQTWTKYIDFSKIKAFVNVAISPGIEWGTRNVILGSGLGGMRPNIVVLGFYNYNRHHSVRPVSSKTESSDPAACSSKAAVATGTKRRRHQDEQMQGSLPTDENRAETAVGPQDYVTVIEDLVLRLKVNVALARGFDCLELPARKDTIVGKLMAYFESGDYHPEENSKKYIDLWPIQMSADISAESSGDDYNITTTNFDTYTLILQLGCILSTVPSWKRAYTLRVAVFVEFESDVEEERGRVETLLSNLRIEAEVLVFWLAAGHLQTYEAIVNGETDIDESTFESLDEALKEEEWWSELKISREDAVSETSRPRSTFFQSDALSAVNAANLERFEKFGRLLHKRSTRSSLARLSRVGINPTMQTHRLDPHLLAQTSRAPTHHPSDDESSSSSSSSSDGEESEMSYSGVQEADDAASQASAASENDRERYEFSDEEAARADNVKARRSTLPAISPPPSSLGSNPASPTKQRSRPSSVHTGFNEGAKLARPVLSTVQSGNIAQRLASGKRPQSSRHKSQPRLTSALMPRTTVATEETAGPSIMFSTPSPPRREPSNPINSIYQRNRSSSAGERRPRSDSAASRASVASSRAASAAATASAQDLSFNFLPCRAQHLILNELMRQHSGTSGDGDTAVVFTTLPPPTGGTCHSEEESLRYLGDLETLCQGLPPVLMIHSNSMSVTMNL